MAKPLVADQNMKEFDPECERHHPLLIVKAINPGCTLELQVENAVTGQLVRLTSGDDPAQDLKAFEQAILTQFHEAWKKVRPYAE